jgi:hypothetical protein
MNIIGVVSGGKGVNHKTLIWVGLSGAVVFTFGLGMMPRSVGIPLPLLLLINVVILNLLIALLTESGLYRSIMIVWDNQQVVIIERASFNRLVSRKTLPLPLPHGLPVLFLFTVVDLSAPNSFC